MEEKALILLYLVTNAFRTYVIYRFLRLFWDRGASGRRFEFLAYLLFYTAVSYSYLKWNIPLVTLTVNIGGLFLVSCLYRLTWKSRVFAIVFCYAVLMCTETIIVYLFRFYNLSPINSNTYDVAWNSMAINLLPFTIVLILEKARKFREGNEISASYCLAAVFVPAATVYLAVCIVQGADDRSMEVILPVIALLALNVVVFYLYDRVAVLEQRKRAEEILRRQNQYYRNQYELINTALTNMKVLRHDLKNQWFENIPASIATSIWSGTISRGSTWRFEITVSHLPSF